MNRTSGDKNREEANLAPGDFPEARQEGNGGSDGILRARIPYSLPTFTIKRRIVG